MKMEIMEMEMEIELEGLTPDADSGRDGGGRRGTINKSIELSGGGDGGRGAVGGGRNNQCRTYIQSSTRTTF